MNQPAKDDKKKPKGRIRRFIDTFILSPIGLGLLITVFCIISLQMHYARSASHSGQYFDWVGTLENNLLDMRFQLRGPRKPSGKVGLMMVDDATIAKYGRWPLNRSSYEKPLNVLKKHGVQWVVSDIFFAEPERPLLAESLPGIQAALDSATSEGPFSMDKFEEAFAPLMEASLGDKSLARGISSFGNVVQSYFYGEVTDSNDKTDYMPEYEKVVGSVIELAGFRKGVNKKFEDFKGLISNSLTVNTSVIAAASEYHAFSNNESISSDAKVRSVSLVKMIAPKNPETGEWAGGQPQFFPHMDLLVAAKYLKRIITLELDDAGVAAVRLMDEDGEEKPIEIPQTNHSRGWTLLNPYGGVQTIPTFSMADVAAEKKIPAKMPDIIFMGVSATGTTDILASSFGRNIPGVELNATMTDNIISQKFLNRPENAAQFELILLVVSGLLLCFVLAKMSALASLLLIFGIVIGAFAIDKAFLFGKGYWVYLGTFYVQTFSIFVSVTVFKYFSEEREKAKVKDAFQHYLNPAVVNQLMANPDKLKLGGEKKELTCFFSDVRSFSTMSENMSPEALTQLLNEYFTPMTQIVLDSGGLLDKYIGDAIMAVWGAPIDQPDQADRAVAASIKMLDVLDVLKEDWKRRGLPFTDIGMGVNSGPMTVGNMGGDQRFDYTVLGDAVNLASRLEGVNKEYKTRTIISEFTLAAMLHPEKFIMRELDLIVVKGKTEPVKIFEVMQVKPGMDEKCRQVSKMFGEALSLYRTQKWNEAEQMLLEILKVIPNDGPSNVFLERCAFFRENPPGAEWNGVNVMTHK
jgi:adenylate cyclase